MRIGRSRGFRGLAAAVAGVLMSAGLLAVPGVVEAPPAGAATIPDQPLSAVASSMWQTNNTVWAIDVANNVVYAGGQFTAVRPPGVALNGAGTVTRNRIAAFNATTGELITTCNPNANNMVYDLEVSPNGQYLYVAGSFTSIGGQTRQRIARLNLPSCTLDTAWSANANAIVATVSATNNDVYVGGDFTTIKNTSRQRIARLNTTNGNVVTAFTANADKRVNESVVAGGRLIVGGEVDVVNNLPNPGVASLSPTTGAVQPWAAHGVSPRLANGGCDANVTDIIAQGTTAYVTSEAPNPGCWEGYYAANISDGALIYNMHCLGGSVGLAIANGWMYRASHNHDCSKNDGGYVGPNNANAFIWYRLEAHRLSDGRLGHWSPTTNGGSPNTSTTVGPQVIATDGTNIYTGGDFSTVNQQAQQGITRFTTAGGNSAPEVPATPRVTATAAGTIEVTVDGVRDNNDGDITINLYRGTGTTPIASLTKETWPWSRAVYRFKDSGLAAGTSVTYRATASDGSATSGFSASSLPVTVGWQNPPDYPTAVANQGAPALHWRLDDAGGPVADASGGGNTGNVVGGVAFGQPGALLENSAIATNGVDGYVTSTSAITPNVAFSNSVWFNTTTERGGAILGFSDAQTGIGLRDNRALFMENDGRVVFGIRRGNVGNPGMSFVRGPGRYNDGEWHQAVTVYNGTNTITLFMDGVQVATLNITQPIIPGPGYFRAGYMDLSRFYTVFGQNYDGRPHVQSYFWNGRIDEPTMYQAALTPQQVAALYASGSAFGAALPPEQPDPGDPPPPPGPSAYPAAVSADLPSMYWRLNELGQLPVADSSGNNRTGTYRDGLTYGAAGALTDTTTAVQSPGGSGVAYTNQQVTNPQAYSLEVFVKTTSNGGKILGLENAQTGWGTTFDRHLYLNAGRVNYGILAGGVMTVIQSPGTVNDGQWHHLVATQGAGGMNLYIDGALVASNAAAIAPDAANGYWRVGGGNLTGWPNAPAASALTGTYDEVAVYPAELPAARVQAHFTAASQAGNVLAPPTNVQANTVTGTTLNLTWDAPAGTVVDYRVFRNGALRSTILAPTQTYAETGLVSGQTYSFTVTARNADGESSPSTALLVTTPDTVAPSVPANLQAPTVNVNQVVLTWNNSSDNVGIPTYEVWRDGVFLANAATNTYSDNSVAANTAYSYQVLAKDSATPPNLSALSTALPVTTPAAGDTEDPSVPANLQASNVTGNSATLTWNASTDNVGVVDYIVTRNGVDLAPVTGTTLVDGFLASGVTYTYTVRARDAANNQSDPSSPPLVFATPDVVDPSTPTGLAASSVSATSVTLTWNASTDNVGVTGYQVRRNGTLIGSPSSPTFTDNTVATGQTYQYTVRALDAAGNDSPDTAALPVTAVNPDPNLFSDNFTGANGAAWGAGWTTAVSNGTATQQSGTGELAFTDVAGAYARAQLSGLAARTDSDTVFSFQFSSTTAIQYVTAFTRGSGGWQGGWRPINGYGVEMRNSSGTIEVIKNVNGTQTTLATVTGAKAVSTAKQWLRLRVVGSTIQFKSWVDGTAEPAAWESTVTDTSVTAAGQLHLSTIRGGSNVGAKNVRIDDLAVLPGV
jgi:chitodextrinase